MIAIIAPTYEILEKLSKKCNGSLNISAAWESFKGQSYPEFIYYPKQEGRGGVDGWDGLEKCKEGKTFIPWQEYLGEYNSDDYQITF